MKQAEPGDLELVRAFVNSFEDEDDGTVEEFASCELAHDWLVQHELLVGAATVSELERLRLIEVREALRSLLRANNGGPPDERAIGVLNEAAAGAGLVVSFSPDGSAQLEPSEEGVQGAIARLLAIVFAATVAGSWPRLKVCWSNTCRTAFYDSSKNHSATWCSMRVCGNRAKVRAYQKRRRAVAG
jgi:predicted RNA-binding Zn ribbon-like protein